MVVDIKESIKKLKNKQNNKILPISNLDWNTIINKFPTQINKINIKTTPPINKNQIVLTIPSSHTNESFVYITNNLNYKIPYLSNNTEKNIWNTIKYKKKTVNTKGIFLKYKKDIYGLFAYIPFEQKKKIVSFYKIEKNEMLFFKSEFKFVNEEDNSIININQTRNINDKLTENDRIYIANTSKRFDKIQYDWKTVLDVIKFLNKQMFKTSDPLYIYKIIELNKVLNLKK
jgi:hypothetical protein